MLIRASLILYAGLLLLLLASCREKTKLEGDLAMFEGKWTLSYAQFTANEYFVPVAGLSSIDMELFEDGTFELDRAAVGFYLGRIVLTNRDCTSYTLELYEKKEAIVRSGARFKQDTLVLGSWPYTGMGNYFIRVD